MSIAYASHGDTKHIMLFPANPEECFYDAVKAFDLAERFQTPVFVVSDLDIGMNDWMVKRLKWDDDFRPDRGKVLDAEELEKIERFSRYLDVGRRRDRGAHAPRREPEGRLLHARLRSRQARQLHRGFGRVPGSDGSSRAQARERGEGRARAGAEPRGGRHNRDRRVRRLSRGDSRGGGPAAFAGSDGGLHAHPRLSRSTGRWPIS